MKVIVVSVSELQCMLDKHVERILSSFDNKLDRQAERIISAVESNSDKSNRSVWLDIEGLMSYHPDKPTRKKIYQWVDCNKIPFHKKAGKLYFLKSEINDWLAEEKCQTQPRVTNEVATNLSNQ